MGEREKELREYHETEGNLASLARVLKRRMGELVKLVIANNECIFLGQEMPEYGNSLRPFCRKNPQPEFLADRFVSPQDCALCKFYQGNPDVKFSVFMKYDYVNKRFV